MKSRETISIEELKTLAMSRASLDELWKNLRGLEKLYERKRRDVARRLLAGAEVN